MNLARLIASENNIKLEQVMLLRHSISKTQSLISYGATIEEYTLVQPTNSKYDFLADGKDAVNVVVIVDDKVHSIYNIYEIERFGTSRTLVSKNLHQWDIDQGYTEKPSKLFKGKLLESVSLGKFIWGWTSKRTSVARYGGRLFESVEI